MNFRSLSFLFDKWWKQILWISIPIGLLTLGDSDFTRSFYFVLSFLVITFITFTGLFASVIYYVITKQRNKFIFSLTLFFVASTTFVLLFIRMDEKSEPEYYNERNKELMDSLYTYDATKAANKWYDDTKSEILKEADKPDSTFTLDDVTFVKKYSFAGGKKVIERWYKMNALRLEKIFSTDGNFELRREVCENGTIAFEGIVYKDHFYGLSEWWHCNGQLSQKGFRCNDRKIGVWQSWNEQGVMTLWTDYQELSRLDSLPELTNTLK